MDRASGKGPPYLFRKKRTSSPAMDSKRATKKSRRAERAEHNLPRNVVDDAPKTIEPPSDGLVDTRQSNASAISVLPDGILVDIFWWLFHGGLGPEKFPPTILLVCHTWRRLALSSKGLWRNMSVFDCYQDRLAQDLQGQTSTTCFDSWAHYHRRGRIIREQALRLLQFCNQVTQASMHQIDLRCNVSLGLDDRLRLIASSASSLRCLCLSVDCSRGVFREDMAIKRERQQVYQLLATCVNLSHLILSMPDPIGLAGSHLPSTLSPLTCPRGLQSLTLADPESGLLDYHLYHTVRPDGFRRTRQHEHAFVAFWSRMASQLTSCDLVTLSDPAIVTAVLEKAQGTLKDLSVRCDIFLSALHSVRPLIFCRLRRLCLLGSPGNLAGVGWAASLPQLEELEGTLESLLWLWDGRIKSVTVWLSRPAAADTFEGAQIARKVFRRASGLLNLTIIGPADEVPTFLEDLALDHCFSLDGDRKGYVSCPCLTTLTLLSGRDRALLQRYTQSTHGTEIMDDEIMDDYLSHRDLRDAVTRIVSEREAMPDMAKILGGDFIPAKNTIRIVTIRDYWCAQHELWDFRVTTLENMTRSPLAAASDRQDSSPRAALTAKCDIDMVPSVPQSFDETLWKNIVREAIRQGLPNPHKDR